MRGRVAIVAVGLALIGAVIAPSEAATAAKVEAAPTEGVILEFPTRHGFRVYVTVHPLLGVAVIETAKGEGALFARSRSDFVDYASRVPIGPAEGRLDFAVPGVASISGELVSTKKGRAGALAGCPESTAASEDVEFRGTFEFTGSGNYLHFVDHQGEGFVESTGDPCEPPAPEEPKADLFSYLESDAIFSNHSTAVLGAELSTPGRLAHFYAVHALDESKVEFEALTREWLPGRVASERRLDLPGITDADFEVSSKAEHPASATVRPPAPFSGRAFYSKARGNLTGSLSVDLLGKRVRLAGRDSKAGVFNFNPGR